MAETPTNAVAATLAHTGSGELHAEPTFLGISAAGFVALSMLVVIAIMIWQRVPRLIARALDGRIDTIRRDLDEASRLRAEAEAMLAAAQSRDANSRDEAASIVRHAEAEAAAMRRKAENDAADLVARRSQMAEDRIGAAERQAIGEVRARAAEVAVRAAGSLIAIRHGAAEDQPVISRAIAGLGAGLSRPN
jgi:F-type H+-transporting ATPase subunit b